MLARWIQTPVWTRPLHGNETSALQHRLFLARTIRSPFRQRQSLSASVTYWLVCLGSASRQRPGREVELFWHEASPLCDEGRMKSQQNFKVQGFSFLSFFFFLLEAQDGKTACSGTLSVVFTCDLSRISCQYVMLGLGQVRKQCIGLVLIFLTTVLFSHHQFCTFTQFNYRDLCSQCWGTIIQ